MQAAPIEQIADGVFLQRHALALMGCEIGRNVTLIRLPWGRVLIHSTAAFSPADIDAIRRLGEPAWLFEATRFHDTFAAAGRAAFPDIPYLVPPGFPKCDQLGAVPVGQPPEEWNGEIEIHPIAGMPKVREFVLFHRPSQTLVLADLVFNLPATSSRWTRAFFRGVAGIEQHPGMSRLYRAFIKDRPAFAASLSRIGALDFVRVIPAHGTIIPDKATFLDALTRHGF
ncbi:hypothetical protein BH23VER1_BH23VER1_17910 [soil metagenome]